MGLDDIKRLLAMMRSEDYVLVSDLSRVLVQSDRKLDDTGWRIEADEALKFECEEKIFAGERNSTFFPTGFPEFYRIFQKPLVPDPEQKEEYDEFLMSLRKEIEKYLKPEYEWFCHFGLDEEGRERDFWKVGKSEWRKYSGLKKRIWVVQISYSLEVNMAKKIESEEEDVERALVNFRYGLKRGQLEHYERERRERLYKGEKPENLPFLDELIAEKREIEKEGESRAVFSTF